MIEITLAIRVYFKKGKFYVAMYFTLSIYLRTPLRETSFGRMLQLVEEAINKDGIDLWQCRRRNASRCLWIIWYRAMLLAILWRIKRNHRLSIRDVELIKLDCCEHSDEAHTNYNWRNTGYGDITLSKSKYKVCLQLATSPSLTTISQETWHANSPSVVDLIYNKPLTRGTYQTPQNIINTLNNTQYKVCPMPIGISFFPLSIITNGQKDVYG